MVGGVARGGGAGGRTSDDDGAGLGCTDSKLRASKGVGSKQV